MGQMDEYKLTHTRPTNELEHDDTATPPTKRILAYGWDGTNKQRIATDSSGLVKIDLAGLTSATPQFARLGLGVAADDTSLLTLAVTGKIEFKGGASFTGTLAWSPLGIRAITFPDDSGTLALLDASAGNNWTTSQYFTALPTGTTFASGSAYINPVSAAAGYTLFGCGVNNVDKFKVDAEGDVTLNSMILGGTTVTTTGTQLNYLNAATGTTGTTSTNLVFSTSPTLVTPNIGAATGTSLNVTNGGLTISTNGQVLTIPYDASNNLIYGNGVGILLPNNSTLAYAYKSALGTNNGQVFDTTTSDLGVFLVRGGTRIWGIRYNNADQGTMLLKVYNQAAEPTTTDLPAGYVCMWTDTDDSKCYFCYNHGGTVKTVELL